MKRIHARVIKKVTKHAAYESNKAQFSLLNRIKSLGFNNNTYYNLRQYVSTCLIYIHFDNLTSIMDDRVYKNCFDADCKTKFIELLKLRKNVEKEMFGYKYKTRPALRPLYGGLNIYNEENGIGMCKFYGSNYLLVNSNLRNIVTLTYKDSLNNFETTDSCIGTCNHFNHLLMKFSDENLQLVLEKSNEYIMTGKAKFVKKYDGTNYEYESDDFLEAQIHKNRLILDKDFKFVVSKKF